MLMTTTPGIEGKRIVRYAGIVTGEAIIGANIFSDFLTKGLEEGYFEQFEGRCGGRESFLEIDDYATEGDLLAFAQGTGMAGTEEEIAYLRDLSRRPGRDRVVLDSLQKAMRLLNGEKRPLTVTDIKMARGEM